ncbi:MAG: hypothetical protein H0X50_10135 [Nitrosopumilus sp.]|nr:hypothetical protein [Nitrosopumilus sp.]
MFHFIGKIDQIASLHVVDHWHLVIIFTYGMTVKSCYGVSNKTQCLVVDDDVPMIERFASKVAHKCAILHHRSNEPIDK